MLQCTTEREHIPPCFVYLQYQNFLQVNTIPVKHSCLYEASGNLVPKQHCLIWLHTKTQITYCTVQTFTYRGLSYY